MYTHVRGLPEDVKLELRDKGTMHVRDLEEKALQEEETCKFKVMRQEKGWHVQVPERSRVQVRLGSLRESGIETICDTVLCLNHELGCEWISNLHADITMIVHENHYSVGIICIYSVFNE